MSEHTEEPWIFWKDGSKRDFVGPSTNYTVAQCFHTPEIDSCEANARRIVACVNACAGIPTDVLEAAPPPPKSESIAYIEHHKGGDNLVWDNPGGKYSVLYTTPLVMKLSDERILEIATRFQDGGDFGWDTNMCEMEQLGFARAIEREILGE